MKQTSSRRIGLLTVFVLGLSLGKVAAQTNITLAWNPSPDTNAAGYNVYVGVVSGNYGPKLDVRTNTSATLAINPTQTNYFVVKAYDSVGIESLPSNQAIFTPAPPVTNQPPPPPPPPPGTNTVVTPQPLLITTAGQLNVSAPGVANGTCILQCSTNLTTWSPVYTNQSGQPLNYLASIPTVETWRYYRGLWVAGTLNASNVNYALSTSNFSSQIVGFVTISAGSGFTAIANPFDSGDNTLAALITNVPDGTALNKYTTGLGFTSNVFSGGIWSTGAATLNPGEGGFLLNPTRNKLSLVFSGTVLQGTVTNDIPPGYSLISATIPLPNPLTSFPACSGDQIQLYNRGAWTTYTFMSGRWQSGGVKGRNSLVISPGDSFFVTKKSGTNWVQSYF